MAMTPARVLSVTRTAPVSASPAGAVAIVGVGTRLPGGVDGLDDQWAALLERRHLLAPAMLDTTGFDAAYFGLTRAEAARLDRRQRLVLECAAEAVDDAGLAAATLAGTGTAVVLGVARRDETGPRRACPAGRVAAVFGLRGPAESVDTAWAPTVVAVRRAAALVRSGQAGLALTGGVHLLSANDSATTEGAGVFVLKSLAAALADGDRVHAVLAEDTASGGADHVEEHGAGAAAGVAGLLTAILVLRERCVPDTTGADRFAAPRRLAADSAARVVGADGHLVLRAPATTPRGPLGTRRLPVVISARTAAALDTAAGRWTHFLDKTEPADFADVAYTSCLRRGHHERRYALLADGPEEAAATARVLADGGKTADGVAATAVRRGRTCFVFDGNGSQWPGMGVEMLATDPVFRAEVQRLDAELTPLLGWSVLAELTDPDVSRWHLVDISQPLLFAVQLGIVASLAARGVVPAVVTGHSVGEVAAAYCAGALDLPTACRVVAERTRAQAATAGTGRLAAMALGPADTADLVAELGVDLAIAAINSPHDVTVCGSAEDLAVLGAEAERRGLFFRDVGLDYPYHGPGMEPVRDMVLTGLAGMTANPCRLTMVSALTGEAVTGPDLDGGHWWRNLRYEVRFSEAIEKVVGEHGCDVLVEIGPKPVLGSYLRRMTEDRPEPVAVVPTMTRKSAGAAALDLTQLHLVAAGARQDWTVFFPERGTVTTLPAYPWQRDRRWPSTPATAGEWRAVG